MKTCQRCSPDVVGCACTAQNTCTGGLLCETGKCRAALTCADQRTAGTCKPHQLCNESPGTDAVCVPATCDPDYTWNAQTGTCQPCVSAGCTAEPTCAVDGGIGGQCDVQHRLCSQVGSTASCGACKPGFTEDANHTCVPPANCGNTMCTSAQYCDTSASTPTCTALPCPDGWAKETGGACTDCHLSCLTDGYTGRVWPYRTLGGVCVCETLPGYFISGGTSGLASKCDADGDGWVNEDADSNKDPAFVANARCIIEKVDTVRLVDEFGTALNLRSCATGGMVPQGADAGVCATVMPLRLLETERNDVPGRALGLPKAPRYGAADAGRPLDALELNSLTKACVNTIGDFNDDKLDDIVQASPAPPVDLPGDRKRLEAFAYFVELYTSWYEPPTAGGYGTLVIRERSRCAPDFPLHYDPAVSLGSTADKYVSDPDAGALYWRNCARRRDPDYTLGKPNFDFAGWTCAGSAGSCPALPPAHPSVVAPQNPADAGLLRNFGVCEMGGKPPADGVWRGFGHHSQFKCISVTSNVGPSGYEVGQAAVSETGDLVLNTCQARPCAGSADPACRTAPSTGLQTTHTVVDCQATVPGPVGVVGFAAVRFRPYGPGYTSLPIYRGGCVNEEAETPALAPFDPSTFTWLCPYPEYFNTYANWVAKHGAVDSSFGRFSCDGDLPNFLWADPIQRATLFWSTGPNDTQNGVWR